MSASSFFFFFSCPSKSETAEQIFLTFNQNSPFGWKSSMKFEAQRIIFQQVPSEWNMLGRPMTEISGAASFLAKNLMVKPAQVTTFFSMHNVYMMRRHDPCSSGLDPAMLLNKQRQSVKVKLNSISLFFYVIMNFIMMRTLISTLLATFNLIQCGIANYCDQAVHHIPITYLY